MAKSPLQKNGLCGKFNSGIEHASSWCAYPDVRLKTPNDDSALSSTQIPLDPPFSKGEFSGSRSYPSLEKHVLSIEGREGEIFWQLGARILWRTLVPG